MKTIFRICSAYTSLTYIGVTHNQLSAHLDYLREMFAAFKRGEVRYNTCFEVLAFEDAYIARIGEILDDDVQDFNGTFMKEFSAVVGSNKYCNICECPVAFRDNCLDKAVEGHNRGRKHTSRLINF